MLSLAMTRLEEFIQTSGFMPTVLAKLAGISRQHLSRLRKGTAEPSRAVMVKLALAAGEMLRRRVFVVEMFDLGESEQLAYGLLISAKVVLGTMPLAPSPAPTGVSSPHER
jgi:transcriptional regulator with XRE-family HTH domain